MDRHSRRGRDNRSRSRDRSGRSSNNSNDFRHHRDRYRSEDGSDSGFDDRDHYHRYDDDSGSDYQRSGRRAGRERDRDRDSRRDSSRSRDGRSDNGYHQGSQELYGGRRRGGESGGGGGGGGGGGRSSYSSGGEEGELFTDTRNTSAAVASITLPFPGSSSARPKRGDWECSKCHALNFARRDRCFGCGGARGGSNSRGFCSVVPTNVLRVSGLRRSSGQLPTPEEVAHALKEFAPVKDAHGVGDAFSGMVLPIYYVEFSCVEHARHTLETAEANPVSTTNGSGAGKGRGSGGGGGLTIDGSKVSMSFAAVGAPPASTSEKALKTFQEGQSAARLAKLESNDVLQASKERAEARAQARAEARVDTGAGLGTGSLALAFDQSLAGRSRGVPQRDAGGMGGTSNGERGVSQDGDGGAGGASREVVRAALEKMLNPREWPPSFQEAGAAYTFDGGSGYFYESSTGVYYDPKSKLYCKNSQWHHHTPGQDPAYTPAEQDQTQREGMISQNLLSSNASSSSHYPSAGGVSLPLPAAGTLLSNSAEDAATKTGAGLQLAGAPSASTAGTSNKRAGGHPVGTASKSGGKKTKIAFGFKGVKLAKPSLAGGGEDAGAGSSDGAGGVGLSKNKRLLDDVSKWNARKLEAGDERNINVSASSHKLSATTGQTAQPLHIAARRKMPDPAGAPSYDPPAPLLPRLPAPLSHLKMPSDDEETSKARKKMPMSVTHGGDSGEEQRDMGFSDRWRNSGREKVDKVQGQDGDVVVACLLCRRSFASAEMLEKHERKSKLHKDNLAKAAAEAPP